MNWDAPHADYVLAAYLVALAIIVWCLIDTLVTRWRTRRLYK
jgi:hypothetical protein